MSLEERLGTLGVNTNEFLAELRKGRINPQEGWSSMPYLKYDLTAAIVKDLRNRGITIEEKFEDNLYRGEFRKEPLKRVYYGMRSSENVPQEVLEEIKESFADLGKHAGEYALMYFFAGIWEEPRIEADAEMPQVVSTLIRAGIENVYKNYYVRKADGIYEADIVLPYSNRIKKRLSKMAERPIEPKPAAKPLKPQVVEQTPTAEQENLFEKISRKDYLKEIDI